MERTFILSAFSLLLLFGLPANSHAQMVTINPTKDNTLFEETPGNSNGAGEIMFTGNNGVTESYRTLMHFDVAGSVPAGATITGVELTLNLNRATGGSGSQVYHLHRLTADWGEGASNTGIPTNMGGGGFGELAIAPDATWNESFFGSTAWASAGGDFNPTVSAMQAVDETLGAHTWGSDPQLVADAQDMLDNPAINFGWLLKHTDEVNPSTARRFDTREAPIPPALQITYTLPPPPMAAVPTMGEWGLIILALLVLSIGTVFMMRRRTAIVGMGEASMSQGGGIPFDWSSFGKMLAAVMISLAVVFTVAVLVFGYEMTNADVPGSLIAAPIAAYLLHLLFGEKE